jgi:hypothetical protein
MQIRLLNLNEIATPDGVAMAAETMGNLGGRWDARIPVLPRGAQSNPEIYDF